MGPVLGACCLPCTVPIITPSQGLCHRISAQPTDTFLAGPFCFSDFNPFLLSLAVPHIHPLNVPEGRTMCSRTHATSQLRFYWFISGTQGRLQVLAYLRIKTKQNKKQTLCRGDWPCPEGTLLGGQLGARLPAPQRHGSPHLSSWLLGG